MQSTTAASSTTEDVRSVNQTMTGTKPTTTATTSTRTHLYKLFTATITINELKTKNISYRLGLDTAIVQLSDENGPNSLTSYKPETGVRIAVILFSVVLFSLSFLLWRYRRCRCGCANDKSKSANSDYDYDMDYWLRYVDEQKLARKRPSHLAPTLELPANRFTKSAEQATRDWIMCHRGVWTGQPPRVKVRDDLAVVTNLANQDQLGPFSPLANANNNQSRFKLFKSLNPLHLLGYNHIIYDNMLTTLKRFRLRSKYSYDEDECRNGAGLVAPIELVRRDYLGRLLAKGQDESVRVREEGIAIPITLLKVASLCENRVKRRVELERRFQSLLVDWMRRRKRRHSWPRCKRERNPSAELHDKDIMAFYYYVNA